MEILRELRCVFGCDINWGNIHINKVLIICNLFVVDEELESLTAFMCVCVYVIKLSNIQFSLCALV